LVEPLGSAIRASIKQKRRYRSILKIVSTAAFQFSSPANSILRFRLANRIFVGLQPIVAIRSVSHLVLARDELMPWFHTFRTERSRSDNSRPRSLRLGFLGQPFYYHTRPFWQARGVTSSAPIPPAAGPENLQCRAAFIHY
jgi:hypothetical protein